MNDGPERLYRGKRTPSVISRIALFIPFLLVGLIVFAVAIPVHVDTVIGIIRLGNTQLDGNEKASYLIVELKTGERINVKLPKTYPMRSEGRVELKRHRTLLGAEYYTFVKYR